MPQAKSSTTSKKSTSTGAPASLARTVGPAIPLAIALLGGALLPGGKPAITTGPSTTPGAVVAVKCEEGIEDFRACHSEYPTGCTISGSAYDPWLNLMKNQTQWSTLQPAKVITSLQEVLDLEGKIPSGLGKGNHGDNEDALRALGEGQIFGVLGYLYDIKVEGAESSNCQLTGEESNVDFHIFIGFDPDLAEKIRTKKPLTKDDRDNIKKASMIVEMTPHYRDIANEGWTSEAVQDQLGKQVRVYGQLMVDNEHFVAGQDCAKDTSKAACWRASVWELHPVTDFKVCDAGNCTPTSAGWTPIGEAPQNASTEASGKGPVKGKP
jgi:hypothetical protein